MPERPFQILSRTEGEWAVRRKDEFIGPIGKLILLNKSEHEPPFWAHEIDIDVADKEREFRREIEGAEVNVRCKKETDNGAVQKPQETVGRHREGLGKHHEPEEKE